MTQRVRTVEDLPEEAAKLAEVASRLIETDPRIGPTLAELARLLPERLERRAAMGFPSDERRLWEEAGASFDTEASLPDVINLLTAFSGLLSESVEGDAAVATLLGVDRSRVSQRLRDRSLYAFSQGGTRYFPGWQFSEGGTLHGLRDVVRALDAQLHPLVVTHWFRTPSIDLEIDGQPASPCTWLKTGGDPQVVAQLAADL